MKSIEEQVRAYYLGLESGISNTPVDAEATHPHRGPQLAFAAVFFLAIVLIGAAVVGSRSGPTESVGVDPVTTAPAPERVPGRQLSGVLSRGDSWTVVDDVTKGFCVTFGTTTLGCDEQVSPVRPPDQAAYKPRTAASGRDLDGIPTHQAGELLFAYLPRGAVGVRLTWDDGRTDSTLAVLDVTGGIWAAPIVPGDNPTSVQYLDSQGNVQSEFRS